MSTFKAPGLSPRQPTEASIEAAIRPAAGENREEPKARAASFPYRATYFCIFAGLALQAAYLNLFFKRAGLSGREIGWLAGALSVLAVLSPPLWGAIADRIGSHRRPILLLMLFTGALYPCFLAFRGFVPALLLAVAFSFVNSPIIPLADAATMAHLQEQGGDYGRIRVWGSIGYAVILAASGRLLPPGHQGPAMVLAPVFLAYPLFRLVGAIFARTIPDGPSLKENGKSVRKLTRKEIVELDSDAKTTAAQSAPIALWASMREVAALFATPRMFLFMFCGFLGWAAMQSYYVFFPIYLDALHVSDRGKGLYIDIGVVAEILFLSQVGRVQKRIGSYGLLSLGLGAQALRLFLFAYRYTEQASSTTLALVGVAQLLHAFTFAAFYVACIAVLTRHVPNRLRAGGQTLFSAMVTGLGGFAGAVAAGQLAHNMGRMFGVAAAIAAFACALSLLLQVRLRRSGC